MRGLKPQLKTGGARPHGVTKETDPGDCKVEREESEPGVSDGAPEAGEAAALSLRDVLARLGQMERRVPKVQEYHDYAPDPNTVRLVRNENDDKRDEMVQHHLEEVLAFVLQD